MKPKIISKNKTIKSIEGLRNKIAHAQDLALGPSTYPKIIQSVFDMKELLEFCERFARQDDDN